MTKWQCKTFDTNYTYNILKLISFYTSNLGTLKLCLKDSMGIMTIYKMTKPIKNIFRVY